MGVISLVLEESLDKRGVERSIPGTMCCGESSAISIVLSLRSSTVSGNCDILCDLVLRSDGNIDVVYPICVELDFCVGVRG